MEKLKSCRSYIEKQLAAYNQISLEKTTNAFRDELNRLQQQLKAISDIQDVFGNLECDKIIMRKRQDIFAMKEILDKQDELIVQADNVMKGHLTTNQQIQKPLDKAHEKPQQIISQQTKQHQHVELDFGALVDQRLSQKDIQKETSLKSKQLEEQLRAEVKQQFSVIQQMQAENENLKESVLVKDRLILNLQKQLQKQKEENEAELKEMREMVLEMQQEIAALGEQVE
ncbi:Hypothetical_protein [Hexamita inflata]|uniref:Hypothetical_protein n=1 Tax=Hexamita inflata TaxID=28002 RepID=A0AA86U305_9EUKA|nr:Hypothetical protein HINF_LOCUS23867 [Hexamita inflata]